MPQLAQGRLRALPPETVAADQTKEPKTLTLPLRLIGSRTKAVLTATLGPRLGPYPVGFVQTLGPTFVDIGPGVLDSLLLWVMGRASWTIWLGASGQDGRMHVLLLLVAPFLSPCDDVDSPAVS